MATVKLGMSKKQFWKCSPKKLIALIKEWNRIEGRGKEEDPDNDSVLDSIPIEEV